MPEKSYYDLEKARAYRVRTNKERPWHKFLMFIRQRCNQKNNPNYRRYGGRGIKCLITDEDLKFLWKRDRGHKLHNPSVDRIDNDGHYTRENCRFIELRLNASLAYSGQKTGYMGISKKGKPGRPRYKAFKSLKGITFYSETFLTLKEAVIAYEIGFGEKPTKLSNFQKKHGGV